MWKKAQKFRPPKEAQFLPLLPVKSCSPLRFWNLRPPGKLPWSPTPTSQPVPTYGCSYTYLASFVPAPTVWGL